METFIKKHLENVNVENLIEFRSEAFISMASTSGRNGNYEIGVNGLGEFVVKTRTETFKFNNPSEAIDKYRELLS